MNQMVVPGLGNPSQGELSSKQKAAVVVRLLLQNGALPALSSLSEDTQTSLAVQLARMPSLPQTTVDGIADEFANAIQGIGMSFPEGIDGALSLLENAISEDAMERLKAMSPTELRRDPWQTLQELNSDAMLQVIQRESTEVAALVLSRLNVSTAAQILGKLPGEIARRIALSMSKVGSVSALVTERIGQSILDQLQSGASTDQNTSSAERVGAILNQTKSKVRDDVLASLDERNPPFAVEVRSNIFTFANIPDRVQPKDIPVVQRDIDLNDLTAAIAAAEDRDKLAVDFILGNISIRMAQNLKDEAEEQTDISEDRLDEAFSNIVDVIMKLEENGDISLIPPPA